MQGWRRVWRQALHVAADLQGLRSQGASAVWALALTPLVYQLPGRGGRQGLRALSVPGGPFMVPALFKRLVGQVLLRHGGRLGRIQRLQIAAFQAMRVLRAPWLCLPGGNPVAGAAHRPKVGGNVCRTPFKVRGQQHKDKHPVAAKHHAVFIESGQHLAAVSIPRPTLRARRTGQVQRPQ